MFNLVVSEKEDENRITYTFFSTRKKTGMKNQEYFVKQVWWPVKPEFPGMEAVKQGRQLSRVQPLEGHRATTNSDQPPLEGLSTQPTKDDR